jgi:hypothetical protein
VIICGVDPGFSGAWVWLDTGTCRILKVEDMPVVTQTVGRMHRRRVDKTALEELVADCNADLVVVEDPGARPRQTGAMAFGFGLGCVHMALHAARIRLETIVPAKWKKDLRVPANKKEAVIRAEELFPEAREMFRGPRGGVMDGRAEAAMLAFYGAKHFA